MPVYHVVVHIHHENNIFRWLNDHLSGKELFSRFTVPAFRKQLSIYVFSYFPFGFKGTIWDLIVSVPDHCLSFYFLNSRQKHTQVKYNSWIHMYEG